MLKLFRIFCWLLVALILLVCLDQALMRLPFDAPGLRQAQVFYQDFRGRLVKLIPHSSGSDAIEEVIGQAEEQPPAPVTSGPRYLYVDEQGVLQFADSLAEVPKRFRQDARPLSD